MKLTRAERAKCRSSPIMLHVLFEGSHLFVPQPRLEGFSNRTKEPVTTGRDRLPPPGFDKSYMPGMLAIEGEPPFLDEKNRKKLDGTSIARVGSFSASSMALTEVIPLLASAAGQSLC